MKITSPSAPSPSAPSPSAPSPSSHAPYESLAKTVVLRADIRHVIQYLKSEFIEHANHNTLCMGFSSKTEFLPFKVVQKALAYLNFSFHVKNMELYSIRVIREEKKLLGNFSYDVLTHQYIGENEKLTLDSLKNDTPYDHALIFLNDFIALALTLLQYSKNEHHDIYRNLFELLEVVLRDLDRFLTIALSLCDSSVEVVEETSLSSDWAALNKQVQARLFSFLKANFPGRRKKQFLRDLIQAKALSQPYLWCGIPTKLDIQNVRFSASYNRSSALVALGGCLSEDFASPPQNPGDFDWGLPPITKADGSTQIEDEDPDWNCAQRLDFGMGDKFTPASGISPDGSSPNGGFYPDKSTHLSRTQSDSDLSELLDRQPRRHRAHSCVASPGRKKKDQCLHREELPHSVEGHPPADGEVSLDLSAIPIKKNRLEKHHPIAVRTVIGSDLQLINIPVLPAESAVLPPSAQRHAPPPSCPYGNTAQGILDQLGFDVKDHRRLPFNSQAIGEPYPKNSMIQCRCQPIREERNGATIQSDKVQLVGVTVRTASPTFPKNFYHSRWKMLEMLWAAVKGQLPKQRIPRLQNEAEKYWDRLQQHLQRLIPHLNKSSNPILVYQHLISPMFSPEPLLCQVFRRMSHQQALIVNGVKKRFIVLNTPFKSYGGPRNHFQIFIPRSRPTLSRLVEINPFLQLIQRRLNEVLCTEQTIRYFYCVLTLYLSYSPHVPVKRNIEKLAYDSQYQLAALLCSSRAHPVERVAAAYFIYLLHYYHQPDFYKHSSAVRPKLESHMLLIEKAVPDFNCYWRKVNEFPEQYMGGVLSAFMHLLLEGSNSIINHSGCKSGKDRGSEVFVMEALLRGYLSCLGVYGPSAAKTGNQESNLCHVILHLKCVLHVFAQSPGTMPAEKIGLETDYGRAMKVLRTPLAKTRNQVFGMM